MLIFDLKTQTAFSYQYRPKDKSEWGVFIGVKVESTHKESTISDVYSFSDTYLEYNFQVENETEFNVIEVFDEEKSKAIWKVYKKEGVHYDEEDEEDERGRYQPSVICEILLEDYPEMFI